MEQFRDKYRVASSRLKGWDYGSNAAYFVTVCTRKKVHHFGNIQNAKMDKNEVGKIVEHYWYEIPKHFSFISLDAFTVMPNHIHGILIFEKENIRNEHTRNKSHREGPNLNFTPGNPETPELGVSTYTASIKPDDEPKNRKQGGKNIKWKPGVLGVVINQYKRICTINARKTHPDFDWQPRFHDHIIRSKEDHNRIRKYITDNPANWDKDEYNSE